MINLLIMILLSYLVGSIPTAIITGKILQGIDIRQHGSGNAGATNVFRVLGWKAGLFVLFFDMGKGLIATVLIYKLAVTPDLLDPVALKIIAGLSAVFGHIWTVFASFQGGKGVGTGAGMLLGLFPQAVGVAVLVFIIVVTVSRYVSLGSILASLTIPIYLLFDVFVLKAFVHPALMILALLIPLLIIFTHRSNIQRLIKGEENKIQFKKA